MLSRRAMMIGLSAFGATPTLAQMNPAQAPPPLPNEVCARIFATDMLAVPDGMEKETTMQPFAKGDVFLGCTWLNSAEDNHAGAGRILQYDADLKPKGVLWVPTTTHLIKALAFAPDGTLWGFESQSHAVIRVSKDGKLLPRHDFGDRPFGNVVFAPDGTLYLGEYVAFTNGAPGTCYKQPADLGGVIGEPKLHRFSAAFEPLETFTLPITKEAFGFKAITHTALHPEGEVLAYCTETSTAIKRFNLKTKQPMADLAQLKPPPATAQGGAPVRDWFIALAYLKNGNLLATRADRIDEYDEAGELVSSLKLPDYGWAMLAVAPGEDALWSSNVFTGVAARFDRQSGAITGRIDTGMKAPKRALAGVAVYGG